MLTITTSAVMASLISALTDTTLKGILTNRVEQLADYDGYDLGELAHFMIIQPGDTPDAIEAALGFSLLTNSAEVITNHGGWLEAVFILGDDGFGWVLLIPNQPGILPDLVHL